MKKQAKQWYKVEFITDYPGVLKGNTDIPPTFYKTNVAVWKYPLKPKKKA